MAFMSTNRSFESLHGHFHSVISSWMKNRRQLSGPVRYIPGKQVKIEKTEKFSQIKSAKGKESDPVIAGAPRMSKLERNSYFDSEDHILGTGGEDKLFDRNEELLEFEDCKNSSGEDKLEAQDVTKFTQTEKVMQNPIMQDVEQVAIDLLATRAFTAIELQKKLLGKKYPLDIVDAVIASMKDRGLLNDGLYAETFSHSRWLSSFWGPRRIKMALGQKGVSESVAEEATKQVFEEEEEDDAQNTQHGISKPALERLYLQATKQWHRAQNRTPQNRKARIVRWLQYRGFNWEVTKTIMKKLESEHPP